MYVGAVTIVISFGKVPKFVTFGLPYVGTHSFATPYRLIVSVSDHYHIVRMQLAGRVIQGSYIVYLSIFIDLRYRVRVGCRSNTT